MISDEEQPYTLVHRLAEAGALIQRHMGDGAIHEAIEAAVEYSDHAEEGESHVLECAFLVGFSEGASRKAFQDNGDDVTAEIMAALERSRPGTIRAIA
jgi:hypothetical protein